MNRAYGILEIKSVDDAKRIIEGIATTPTPDRVGDVVEPMGAKFALPLPLLWQHQSDNPVGFVETAKRTKDGIPFKARLVKIEEPGPLKDTVDKAWQAVKAGLVRGVSIGFKAIERSFLDGGGIKFSAWEWLELSLVTIPMNSEATISAIKSFDAESLAALGPKGGSSVVRVTPPGASGPRNRKPPQEGTMKTITEQIREWEATLAAKSAKMEEIMSKSADTGETLDEEQSQEYDGLKEETGKIVKHIDRLRDMDAVMKSKAKPVIGSDPDEAGESRDTRPRVQVLEPKLDKGIGFARYAMCLGASGGNPVIARELAQQHYPNYKPLHDILRLPMIKGGIGLKTVRDLTIIQKAVAAGTTSHSDHHSALVNYQDLAGEFVEYLRPRTIVGQFGTGNIPALRSVPFNIRVPRQTTKATGHWVGEGKPKPVTSFNTEQITLDFFKAATICVLTDELVRFSNPSAEALVRDELAAAIIEVIDIAFIDPANSGSASVKPASITNGQTTVASAGDTADNVRTDVKALLSEFNQANIPVAGLVWIMNANVALSLSMMMNDLGQPEFPSITMSGGTFVGIPVLVSQYVPEAVVVLMSAPNIYLADDGNVSIATSSEASIEMLDAALQQDATSGTGASLVSMFQTNCIAIRAEREINWRSKRDNAVTYLTSANWGGTPGSGDI